MMVELRSYNFSVALWINPFCNVNTEIYNDGVQHNYWVMRNNISDDIDMMMAPKRYTPALVKGWDGVIGLAVLDITNPNARKWFTRRLLEFKNKYNISGYKFDAGETVYMPQLTDPNIVYYDMSIFANRSDPLQYTKLYVGLLDPINQASEEAEEPRIGGGKSGWYEYSEVRSSYQSQHQSNFVRVMDLDSNWGYGDGLQSVIPRVLLFSTLGYRYTLPDMVGGNGYGRNGDLSYRGKPSFELYIRWLQMNVMLPLQMSISPWRYESHSKYSQLLDIVKRIFQMRNDLSHHFVTAIAIAKKSGVPIVRPMWYAAHVSDKKAFGVEDQYLLGDNLVVAPILVENTTSRIVYLPMGTWKSCGTQPCPGTRVRGVPSQGGYSTPFKNCSHIRRVLPEGEYFTVEGITLFALPPCYERVI